MLQFQKASLRGLVAVAGAMIMTAAVTSTAAGAVPQPSAVDLIAAPAKVRCVYDKLSLDSRNRYQKSLLSEKTPKKEEAALDAMLQGPADACTQQYGYSDDQLDRVGHYLVGRLIFESRLASLSPAVQAEIPQMFSEMPAPVVAGWITKRNNSVEKKYQAFFATFMQKYKLDEPTAQRVLDVLESAAIIRDLTAQFDHP
jgi:hypothetical protein